MNTFASTFRKVFYHSNLLYSIRILISLIGSTFVPYFFDKTELIMPLTLGVVAAALTEIDMRFLSRIFNLIITLICFTIVSFTVNLLFPYPAIFILGLILLTFIFTLLGALGQRYAVISFGSLLIAAYTMLGYNSFEIPFDQTYYLLIGACWYTLVSIVESILQPIRTSQQNLSKCFYQLALYLDAKATLFDPDETDGFKKQILYLTQCNRELIDILNQTKSALFNRLKGYRGQYHIKQMLNYYFVAQDIHERVSSSHGNYQALSQRFKHSDILFRFARILNLQSKACIQLAQAIRLNQIYQHDPMFAKYFVYLDESITRYENQDYPKSLISSLKNLYHNLQSIDLLLANINTEQALYNEQEQNRLIDDELAGFKDIFKRIKRQFTLKSVLFRHAIRMSIVFSIGYAIIQLSDLPHGYWIILTSLFVCQPNYVTTKYRLRLRVLGTIIGIVIGIPLTYLLPNIEAQLVLIVLSGWLFFLFKNSQYAYATAFITLLVFFCFGLLGESSISVAIYRIIATLIGCFIAWFAVSFIWPDWRFRHLSVLIERLFHDNCHYLALIGMQYQHGKTNDVNYRLARRNAHESNAELSSLITLMTKEPNANQATIDEAFRLLTLDHTLISYISTLGAHRDKILSGDVLSFFDDLAVYIINTLSNDLSIDKDYEHIKQSVTTFIDEMSASNYNNSDFLVMQQLLLILELLPEMTELAQQLSKKR